MSTTRSGQITFHNIRMWWQVNIVGNVVSALTPVIQQTIRTLMKTTQTKIIGIVTITLSCFMTGLLLEAMSGCLHVRPSIWLTCLAAATITSLGYYYLDRTNRLDTPPLSKKEGLLMGVIALTLAYCFSLTAAGISLLIGGLLFIGDYAHRHSQQE